MAYAFDKINKYLDKKTKDESEELYRRPATRSQTAGTDHDFKSLTPYPGRPGALSTTGGIKGNKFSKAAAGRKSFKSLRGEKGDRIPGFLGGLRSDFEERKESLKKKAEEFKTKTAEEDKKATSLPQTAGDENASEEIRKDQTIEDALITGANENNTNLYKSILEGSKTGGPEIAKPELPPLPKISIPEGKQVSKQAIADILRSGKKRYTPGISDFDTRLFYSIPGFAENVKSLGKDQAALRGELETLYEETYTKAVADRKKKYDDAANRIDKVVKQTAGNLTQKQINEAEILKRNLKDFYEKQDHRALGELNKIIRDKYNQRDLGIGFGEPLDSGFSSGTLNQEVLRRFAEVGPQAERDKLLFKYLNGETITQDDWKDLYGAQAFGTEAMGSRHNAPDYRITSPADINTVDPSHMWTPDEVAMMKRAKALGDIRGQNNLQIPSVGKFGDQRGPLELTLTNPAEKASNYPTIHKRLYGDKADISRKYKNVYDDIIKNQGVYNRSGTGRFSGLFPYYHYNALPLYKEPGRHGMYEMHKKALGEGDNSPGMSYYAYMSMGGNPANWMTDRQDEIMPAWGGFGRKDRGTKNDPYSKVNQDWFRPAMVGNIASQLKKNNIEVHVKNMLTSALIQYASNSMRGSTGGVQKFSKEFDGFYNPDKAWRKSISKMLGAARGSGYNFSQDTSPAAMKIKNSLPGDWKKANYSNVNSLSMPSDGVGPQSNYVTLMNFLSHKLSHYSVADLLYQTLAPTTRRNAGNKRMRGGIFNNRSDTLKFGNTAGGWTGTQLTNSWVNPNFYKKAFNDKSTVLTPNDARILTELENRGGITNGVPFEALGFRSDNRVNMYADSNLDKKAGTHRASLNRLLNRIRYQWTRSGDILTFMMLGNSAMQQAMGANENYVW